MVNRIRFSLVILMGIMCLAGCSADKEALLPCPYGFSDWVGGAPNLKEETDDSARDSTELENCIKARCRKDAKCIAKELARAKSAWFWGIISFFTVRPLDLIIMVMLIILILKWPMPYPERWYHNKVLWAFLTYFVPLLLIAIFIRGDSPWTTVFWWLSLIILTFIFIKLRQREYDLEMEYEDEDEDEDEEEEEEPCPLCGGSQCHGRYCEKGLGLLPDYKEKKREKSCPLCGGNQCHGRYCEKGLGLLPDCGEGD